MAPVRNADGAGVVHATIFASQNMVRSSEFPPLSRLLLPLPPRSDARPGQRKFLCEPLGRYHLAATRRLALVLRRRSVSARDRRLTRLATPRGPRAACGPSEGAHDDRQRPVTPTTTQLSGMLRSDAAPRRRGGSIPAVLIRRRCEAYRLPRGVRSTSVRPSNDLHVPLVGLRQGCNAESPPTCELVNRLTWSLHEGGGSLHARP